MSQLRERSSITERVGGVDLEVVAAPTSPAAEAYRSLRATVKFADTRPPIRSLLVADAGAGGQHRVVAANLAAALALAGDGTILIDADLRQPRLHELFGLANQTGLGEWLLSPDPAQPLPLVETGIANLRLLPAGHAPAAVDGAAALSPADLLSSDRAGQLLARLREEAEFVVVDAPPLSEVADALALAARVDGVLLLVRSGKTKRSEARRAREALDRVGARLLGAVLTDPGRRWRLGG